MEEFIKKMRSIYPVSGEAIELLLANTEKMDFPKGYLLIRDGVVERYVYFIVKGFARGYFYKDGKDITIWFASPGMSLLSMNAYVDASAGYENVELLEDCELLRISNERLNLLFRENIEIANWGRRMSDLVILNLEKLFMERYFVPAAERYHSLIRHNPEILQKSSLRHIASYLGISQVSLSRIRAGIQ